jgi:restriction endonuclease Mrr
MNSQTVLFPEPHISTDLTEQLLTLPFEAFERVICSLLPAMGYHSARIVSRKHFKGRHEAAGADLIGLVTAGSTEVPVYVMVKQFRRPVQRRFVDELRGAMVRQGVTRGLIVTTGMFPSGTQEAARAVSGSTIGLIDGAELCSLLVQHRIGVCESWNPTLWVDTAFFERLAAKYQS